MNRLWPLLNAFIGLMLIVQGASVASANSSVTAADRAAAVEAAVPCHGDQPAGNAMSCCDADCPNMATCAFGHLATAQAQSAAFEPVTLPTAAAAFESPAAVPPQSLLRPPISLHL